MGFSQREYQSRVLEVVYVNQDDSPVTLEYGKSYVVNNDGMTPADPIELNLPTINAADVGKKIWIRTRYDDEPDLNLFGHALLKSGDFSFRGTSSQSPDLFHDDSNFELTHDGVSLWLYG